MIDMQKAIDHVIMVANDNTRGYSQTRRAEEKEDDCSSLALDALKLAGVDIGAATYTGDAIKPLLAAGFVDVAKYIDLKTGNGLKKYDVLLRPATSAHGGHMAIMVTDTDLIQAAGDLDKKRGDSSGKEIYTRSYIGAFSTPPKYVLRLAQPVPVGPVGPAGQPGVFEVGEMVKIVVSANTASDGSGKSVELVYQTAKIIKIVTNVTHPYGLCYNGDGYIDAWFKAESIRK